MPLLEHPLHFLVNRVQLKISLKVHINELRLVALGTEIAEILLSGPQSVLFAAPFTLVVLDGAVAYLSFGARVCPFPLFLPSEMHDRDALI